MTNEISCYTGMRRQALSVCQRTRYFTALRAVGDRENRFVAYCRIPNIEHLATWGCFCLPRFPLMCADKMVTFFAEELWENQSSQSSGPLMAPRYISCVYPPLPPALLRSTATPPSNCWISCSTLGSTPTMPSHTRVPTHRKPS